MHWLNAVAMIIMIGSGWKIYNDEVIVRLAAFSRGGSRSAAGPSRALQWHFFAMWILVINGLCYLAYGLVTGRFQAHAVADPLREMLIANTRGAAPRLSHDDLNRLQRRAAAALRRHHLRHHRAGAVRPGHLEAGAVLRAVVSVLRFPGRAPRRISSAWSRSSAFVLVHVALALLVPQTLVAMVTGGPEVDDRQEPPTADPPACRGIAGGQCHDPHAIAFDLPPQATASTRACSRTTSSWSRRSTGARSCAGRSASAP